MFKTNGRTCAKAVVLGTALLASTSAFAQWQGTWGTTYGDVKLQESGKYVYGDYGNWGTIGGLKSADGKTMRGVYRRNDDGTYGYFEWRLAGGSAFVGRWVKPSQTLPRWNSGGTKWVGNRKATARPRLSVYRGGGNIGTFMGAQQAKYQRWAGSLYASNGSAGGSNRPDTASLGQSNASSILAPQSNPLAGRFPKLEDYSVGFKPSWFEVSLTRMGPTISINEGTSEYFGILGIYAYCETASGSRLLKSFGNLKPRVFDRSRRNSAKVRRASNVFGDGGVRRFAMDKACLADPQARLKVQLQTNLKEAEPGGGKFDEVYGYRSLHFYLDDLPSSKGSSERRLMGGADRINLVANDGSEAFFSAAIRDPEGARGSRTGILLDGSVRFTQ